MPVDPVPVEQQFEQRLRDIERRLDDLTLARNLRSATIDDPGVLQVRTGSVVTALFGRLRDGLMGGRLSRQSGEIAFSVQGNAQNPATQFVALWDRSGNIIVSDDATSGQGLGAPWLHFTLASLDSATYSGTQSGAFTTLEQGYPPRTHPRLVVTGLVKTDAATAGEVRLMVGSTQIGATQTVSADQFTILTFTGPWALAEAPGFLSSPSVAVQARVTSGTGFIRWRTMTAYGVQS